MSTRRALVPLISLTLALFATACASSPGTGQNGELRSDGSVGDACDPHVCAEGEHCELLATPCAPDSPTCEPVPACVPDATVDCTDEECGPLPPTLPCADGSAVPQVCTRNSAGTCYWEQPACPAIGDPCTGCEPCPIPEFGECRWTAIGVCSQASDSCV